MWAHDGEQPPIRPVVSAMAAPLVEKDEAFVTEERFHVSETDIVRRSPYLLNEFFPTTHRFFISFPTTVSPAVACRSFGRGLLPLDNHPRAACLAESRVILRHAVSTICSKTLLDALKPSGELDDEAEGDVLAASLGLAG
jgi:hypothetical protein